MDKILFFDGVCVMCNSLVDFALQHDKKQVFKFAPLQGKTAQRLIPELNQADLTSVVLLDDEGIHTQSDAIIRLFTGVGGIYRLAILWRLFLPKSIRDRMYRYIAERRYRWFGKLEQCRLPSPGEQKRILD